MDGDHSDALVVDDQSACGGAVLLGGPFQQF